MKHCLFCAIIDGKQPSVKIYEDDKTVAILDKFPIAENHTLIIPKRHSTNLLDIEPEDARAIGATISYVAKAIKQVLNCDGINVYQGNEKAAMQEIMHTHFHIIPRYYDDEIVFRAQRMQLEENPNIVAQLKSKIDQISKK
jgi:histidine triad (HIT) family protein